MPSFASHTVSAQGVLGRVKKAAEDANTGSTGKPRLVLFAVVVSLTAMSWHADAQSRGPDLLGLYPGMPADQARKVLQAHSDVARIIESPRGVADEFELPISIQDYADTITVLTTHPAKPPVVWLIRRTLNAFGPKQTAKSTMLDALRQKFGKETAIEQPTHNATRLWWLFDQNGRLVPSANLRMLKDCQSLGSESLMRLGPQTASQELQACYASTTLIAASLQEERPGMLVNTEVTLFSLPIGYQAALAVRKAQVGAAEKQRKEELDRARQNRPKF